MNHLVDGRRSELSGCNTLGETLERERSGVHSWLLVLALVLKLLVLALQVLQLLLLLLQSVLVVEHHPSGHGGAWRRNAHGPVNRNWHCLKTRSRKLMQRSLGSLGSRVGLCRHQCRGLGLLGTVQSRVGLCSGLRAEMIRSEKNGG